MALYTTMERYGKYLVVKTEPYTCKKAYLQSCRNGKTIWYFDPLYGRPYSKQTALKHIKELELSEKEA